MSCVRITINGSVLWEGDTSKTVERPPEFIASMLKPQSKIGTIPEPHMQAIAIAFMHGVLTNKDKLIDVRHEPTWWSITVKDR